MVYTLRKMVLNKKSNITKNQDGVAIMMVMTAVVLLTTIMLSFGIDTNINKIRSYNLEDKAQAKLTAESGLRFAMARLKLYQAGYNYIQNNDSLKDIAKPEILNTLWNFPFVYPIPKLKSMNKIQKEAIEKFEEGTLLSGSMRLTISNLSNKLNLNAIRIALFNQVKAAPKKDEDGNVLDPDEEYSIEAQLFKNFQNSFQSKSDSDDAFNDKYSGIEIQDLISVIKYNLSDEDSLEDIGNAQSYFSKNRMTPKYAPLSSMQEMYAMPGWDDELVELIKNEFTVHGSIMIDLNKITENMLRLLIPEITDDEVKDFFEYKNDPEDPKFFNSIDDFKRYVTTIGNIMSDQDFDDLVLEFELNNIKFGASPSLFKVTSVAEKGRATYTLEAYVIMPAKPAYVDPNIANNTNTTNNNTTNNNSTTNNNNNNNTNTNNNSNNNNTSNNNSDKEPKVFLLSPRIVEIYSK